MRTIRIDTLELMWTRTNSYGPTLPARTIFSRYLLARSSHATCSHDLLTLPSQTIFSRIIARVLINQEPALSTKYYFQR